METTGLLASNKIWDPIRESFVEKTPEEEVRQSLVQKMVSFLGFPKSLIAVEKSLNSFQDKLSSSYDPSRRVDVLSYALIKGKLVPLLLVECKKEKITDEALSQAFGYNTFALAPFVAIASKEKIQTFWKEEEKTVSIPFLPSYKELLKAYQKSKGI